jgi:hypothetical protein
MIIRQSGSYRWCTIVVIRMMYCVDADMAGTVGEEVINNRLKIKNREVFYTAMYLYFR